MHPQARADGIVVQDLVDEVIVFDFRHDRAHRLNRALAVVWRHCDGRTDAAGLAAHLARELGTPADERVAEVALAHLAKIRLLERPVAQRGRLTRREAIAAGVAGALALVLEGCDSVTAPAFRAAMTVDGGIEQQPCGLCPTCLRGCAGTCRRLFRRNGAPAGPGECLDINDAPNVIECRCVLARDDDNCVRARERGCEGRCPPLFRSEEDAKDARNPIQGRCQDVAGACKCVYRYTT